MQRPGREGRAKTLPLKNRSRCKLHGGKSTGPRTTEGKARVIAVHTKHGRRSKAHVERVKAINAELRRIAYELKRGERLVDGHTVSDGSNRKTDIRTEALYRD